MKMSFRYVGRFALSNRKALEGLLVAAFLSLLPPLQLFTLGYLYQSLKHYHTTGQIEPLAWSQVYHKSGLFLKKGIMLLCLIVVFWTFPLMLSWVLSIGIRSWFPQGLRYLGYAPFGLGLFFSPCIFAAALMQWMQWEEWSKMGQLWEHIPLFLHHRGVACCGVASSLAYTLCCSSFYGLAFFMLVSFVSYYFVSVLKLQTQARRPRRLKKGS